MTDDHVTDDPQYTPGGLRYPTTEELNTGINDGTPMLRPDLRRDDHVTDDYAELRAALPDATPGPWRHGPLFWEGWAEVADGGSVRVFEVPHAYPNGATQPGVHVDPEIGRGREPDARYIAAANPSVIAALLADHDQKTEALLRYGVHSRDCAVMLTTYDGYTECTCGFRAALRGSGAAEEAGRG